MANYKATLVAVGLLALFAEVSAVDFADAQPGDDVGDDDDPGDDDDDDDPGDDDDDDGDDNLAEGAPSRETIDLTEGMRTDAFTTAARAPDGTIYIGTSTGRIYRSAARDRDWDELSVLPEVKELFGFSAQYVLLGHIRNDDSRPAPLLDLHPPIGARPTHANQSLALLHGGLGHLAIEEGISAEPVIPSQNSLSLSGPLNFAGQRFYFSPLDERNDAIVDREGLGGSAASGLSARAPRLSLLQRTLRRPIAALNLSIFLRGRTRNSRVSRIAIDPSDLRHLLVATRYGLFESRDRGDSFVRVFPGTTASETDTREIIYDPHDPKRLLLGTGRGLFVSTDGGGSFTKHGFVPEVAINKVAFDPSSPRNIYVATESGLYRSTDGGETFSLGFFSSLRQQRTIYWVEVDKNEPKRVYLGTADGAFFSANAPTVSSTDWEELSGMRLLNLSVFTLQTCKGRPGQIYAQTSAALPTNIYFGYSPESYLIESRDGGTSWGVAVAGRSRGMLNWFTIDANDCDRVWTLWSNAVLESRAKVAVARSPRDDLDDADLRDPDLPSMSVVIAAALEHSGLELEDYAERAKKLKSARWLPTEINATFFWGRTGFGGVIDDFQFADDRYRSVETNSELRAMAWASWDLSLIHYHHEAIPMIRSRIKLMNDVVRVKVMTAVFRHYRELLVARARQRAGGGDLYRRTMDRVLIDQHHAVVDLATGGLLSRSAAAKKRKN